MKARSRISMYLGSSKFWWAYLGLLSNPALREAMRGDFDRAVLFDDVERLVEAIDAQENSQDHFFFVFWDGLQNAEPLREARDILAIGTQLSAVYVGTNHLSSETACDVWSLYPDGPLTFAEGNLNLDERTSQLIRWLKIKHLLIPVKNFAGHFHNFTAQLALVFGPRRVVFCGTYGTPSIILASLCERYGVSEQLLDTYPKHTNGDKIGDLATSVYIERCGLFLASLMDTGQIESYFFSACMQLLGRAYLLACIEKSGIPHYIHGYTEGVNVNVYTTPFYRQHLFVDFGSVVGSGNYPRLADLRYFKKHYISVCIAREKPNILELAREGRLKEYFEREWKVLEERIAGEIQV
jgi:hypothetical protein